MEGSFLKQHVTPKELSRAIGVSESSLKRWADGGMLAAAKTVGGHRRFTIEEAIRFIRQTGMKVIAPGAIGLPDLIEAQPAGDPAALPHVALSTAMINGEAAVVRGTILGAFVAGQSVAAIFDRLVTPALHDIGELWRHDAKGIYMEHRATALCIESIHQLRSLFPAATAEAPAAVGGALSGDIYSIPSLMAATVLAGDGWREMNLGPDTPVDSLLLAADEARAHLVWVSVSVDLPAQNLSRQITLLAEGLRKREARLVIGGRAVPVAMVAKWSHVHVARSMGELAAYAAGLRAVAVV